MHSSRAFSILDKDPPRPRYLEGFWRRQARKIEAVLSCFALRGTPIMNDIGTVVRFTIQKGRGTSKLHKQRISFFELPAEVRNTIYHYALSVPEGLPIGVERVPHLGPPLLSASARIREEGSIIYYRSNEFQAQDVDCAVDFLKSLCVCALPLLRAIRIPLHGSHRGDFTQYLSQEQVQRHHLCWRLLQSGLFSAGLRDDCISLGFDNHYYNTTADHYCESLPVSLLYLSRYQFDLLAFMLTSSPPKNWSDVHVMRAIVKNSDSPRLLPAKRLEAARRHAHQFPCKDLCEDCLQSPEAMANPQVLYCESELHCQMELPPTPECPGSYHVPVAAHLNKHFIDVPGQPRSKSRMASRLRCAKCDHAARRTFPWLRFAGYGARR